MTRPPDVLVIGAQKCATTTLYEDLRAHPRVYLGEKESEVLCGPAVDAAELGRRYDQYFRGAADATVLGEVSTRYSMLPRDPNTAHNAATVAPGARIVYIVRDPLERTVSHHHHDFGLGLVGPDIDEAVDSYPPLLDNSRYATQLTPWVEAFGSDAVLVVTFEDYVGHRRQGCTDLLHFIGVDDGVGVDYDPGTAVHNAAEIKHVATGRWGALSHHPLYRRLRPLLGEKLRGRIGRAVLPQAPPRPPGPSAATVDRMVAELAPEVERLAELTGRPAPWDLAASAERLRARARADRR